MKKQHHKKHQFAQGAMRHFETIGNTAQRDALAKLMRRKQITITDIALIFATLRPVSDEHTSNILRPELAPIREEI